MVSRYFPRLTQSTVQSLDLGQRRLIEAASLRDVEGIEQVDVDGFVEDR